MILPTLNPRYLGQVDEGLWVEDVYHPDQMYLVLGKATLADWLREQWSKGRSPDPDPFNPLVLLSGQKAIPLADERLRFYDVILID